MSFAARGGTLRRADPTTFQDKFMVGYQGWFTCAGDGEPIGPGHHGWLHWFNYPIPDGGRPNTDLWPDLSEYSPSELYPAPGLKYESGEQAFLFSSRNPKTVQRHFHWMALHGVDGAFLQRFAGQCEMPGNEGIRRVRDEVGDRVKEAAEKEGRVFAIMYDVSGVAPDKIQRIIEQDWTHLIRDKGVLDSPNYLREKGKAVIALWGFGFEGRNHSPSLVRAIMSSLQNITPGGVYIVAGVPAHWRTSVSDADPNPEFVNVWLEAVDAISPWTIGRYGNENDADRFAEEKIKGDVELLRKRAAEGKKKVDYLPVVLPGGTGYNLSEGKWSWNGIKRNGGRFMWRQLWNLRRHGVRTVYGAMWDEYDEGTVYLPVVSHKKQLPVSEKFKFMALDEDGYDLPSDWYMRICAFAAEGLRGERIIQETFPSKELEDYWSTHPKYENDKELAPSASSSGQAYQQWLASQGDKDKDELPPPPYSMETDNAARHSQQYMSRPPPPPMSTRPLSIQKAHSVMSSTSGPPPLPTSTRPTRPSTSQHPADLAQRPSSAVSVSKLTNEFDQHSISVPHTSRPPVNPSTRPLSPSSTAQSEPVMSLPVPDLRPSRGSTPSPEGGFVAGPGSQWPPPEWNVNPSPHHPTPGHSGYPQGADGADAKYQPAYIGPPPLQPRPSLSSRPQHSSYDYPGAPHSPGSHPVRPHSHSPQPQPQPSSYDPPIGGFAFPQAQTADNYYGGGPSQPQQQWQYQVYQRPSSGYGFQSSHFDSNMPQSPSGPMCPAPGFSGGMPPQPPPSHPPHAYGGSPAPGAQQPPNPPVLSSGPLRYALGAVDKVAGQGTSSQIERGIGSITKTGNKLFSKFTK